MRLNGAMAVCFVVATAGVGLVACGAPVPDPVPAPAPVADAPDGGENVTAQDNGKGNGKTNCPKCPIEPGNPQK